MWNKEAKIYFYSALTVLTLASLYFLTSCQSAEATPTKVGTGTQPRIVESGGNGHSREVTPSPEVKSFNLTEGCRFNVTDEAAAGAVVELENRMGGHDFVLALLYMFDEEGKVVGNPNLLFAAQGQDYSKEGFWSKVTNDKGEVVSKAWALNQASDPDWTKGAKIVGDSLTLEFPEDGFLAGQQIWLACFPDEQSVNDPITELLGSSLPSTDLNNWQNLDALFGEAR